MNGLYGVVRRDGRSLDPAELHALAACQTSHGDATARPDAGALVAHGWAHSTRQADGLWIAGSAHLVNRAELACEHGVPGPLETIAELYRKHGRGTFERLQGQFCLAIYDDRARRLVLATDRFATRPIYYTDHRGALCFGTSLNRVVAGRSRDVDQQAILEYLLYTAIPAPRTSFMGVYKLPAGHVLTLDRGDIHVTPYWDMTYPESRNGSVQSWARQLRAEIESAVRRQVEAEDSSQRIGAFLSGGTDSSTVSGMISRIAGRPAQTFSIGYAEEGYDELSYARVASRWFGTVQHEWKLSPAEALAALPAIVGYYEEPFGNASALPTYRCAQLAREHGVTVLFAGDGGDELFAGNERYRTQKIFGLYQRIPQPLRTYLADPLFLSMPDSLPLLGRARRYVRRSNIPNPRRLYSYDLMLSAALDTLLTREFLGAVEPDALLTTAETHFNRPPSPATELNRMMYLDLKLAIADNDVRKVSGMTELAGVEVRYPFLDTKLAEFSGRIPTSLKVRGLQKRYLFKQALADFLPPAILRKPKHGFGAPIGLWMKADKQWRDFVADVLHDRRTRERGYLLPAVLDGLWTQHQEERSSYYGDLLWPVVMLELWHRAHVGGQGQ